MTNLAPALLSDHQLLIETKRAAASERRATALLLTLLAEVDARKLYLCEGFSSLFGYATQRLQLSEPAAYGRITAARTARRFPIVMSLLDEGAISLTTVSLLSPHLTEENQEALLDAAKHKSKREVECLVAALQPQPDIAGSVRALPIARSAVGTAAATPPARLLDRLPASEPPPSGVVRATTPSLVAPLAPRRYLVRMTVSEETHQKLRQASDLLRHTIPDGDTAKIVDRALTVLVDHLLRTKAGVVARPGPPPRTGRRTAPKNRHVPASVRREVWARDQGRCAFIGSSGRCAETGRLEFHHVVPFARGGPTTVDNVQLRCRSHNAYEGDLAFGDWRERVRPKSGAETANSVRTELTAAGDSG